nr:hypothetical protein [Sulfurihydrogenibium subterraneum]
MLKEGKEKNIEELETGRRTGCYVSINDKRNFLAHSGLNVKSLC